VNYEVEINNIGKRIVVSNENKDKSYKFNDKLFNKAKELVFSLDLKTMHVKELTSKLNEIR